MPYQKKHVVKWLCIEKEKKSRMVHSTQKIKEKTGRMVLACLSFAPRFLLCHLFHSICERCERHFFADRFFPFYSIVVSSRHASNDNSRKIIRSKSPNQCHIVKTKGNKSNLNWLLDILKKRRCSREGKNYHNLVICPYETDLINRTEYT